MEGTKSLQRGVRPRVGDLVLTLLLAAAKEASPKLYLRVKYAPYYDDIRTHWALDKDAPASRPVQRTGNIKSPSVSNYLTTDNLIGGTAGANTAVSAADLALGAGKWAGDKFTDTQSSSRQRIAGCIPTPTKLARRNMIGRSRRSVRNELLMANNSDATHHALT